MLFIKSILLCIILSQTNQNIAIAGNDSVFFQGGDDVYSEEIIRANKTVISHRILPGAAGLEFKPVEIIVSGTGELGRTYTLASSWIGFGVEGDGVFQVMLPAVYGGELYVFSNLNDLKSGNYQAVLGQIRGKHLYFYPSYKTSFSIVDYNPKLIDKIMSWIISLGGRVTEADQWLEIKVLRTNN